MDEKQFEQDYRNWKRQSAPDLWNRIEGNLKDYPERESERCKDYSEKESERYKEDLDGKPGSVKKTAQEKTEPISKVNQANKLPDKKRIYRLAAGFAAILCFAAFVPGLYQKYSVHHGSGAGLMETAYSTELQETTAAEKFKQTQAAKLEETQVAAKSQELQKTQEAAETKESKETQISNGSAGSFVQTSNRLVVPEDAITLSSDSAYFSQAILCDTELLCTGTVEDASLEYDKEGRAVRVVYQLSLNQIHFAQDYFTQTSPITVKSPIVKAEGDEAWILYQMEPGKTYLLPLIKQEGNWELLYPFAPQIQQTKEHTYLFHSGYSSLITKDTQVAAGIQEGENDYFYDRMLLRGDDRFLSDFLELIQMPQ